MAAKSRTQPEPDDDEDDEHHPEDPDGPGEREPPDNPDVEDLREQLALAKRAAETAAEAANKERERADLHEQNLNLAQHNLAELEAKAKAHDEELDRLRTVVKTLAGAGDVASEAGSARKGDSAGTPVPPQAPPPAQPPAAAASLVPRRDRVRYKDVPENERYDLTEADVADIEHILRVPTTTISQALQDIGAPVNRYTLDQVRSVDRRLSNMGLRGAETPKPGGLGSLEDMAKTVKTLQDLGIVYSAKEVNEMLRRRDADEEGDPETKDLKELAHVGREMLTEVVDAARDISGHPKRGTRVADELLQRTTDRRIQPSRVPELPPGQPPAAAPAAPSMGGTEAPAPAQNELSRLAVSHPEALATFDYVIQLAPRIYDIASQEGPDDLVQQNAIKDASVTANLVWLGARDRKPAHLMDRTTGRCVRCNVANTPEHLGKPCPVSWSQKDMLRALRGTSVKSFLQNISRYQSAIEMNSPMDSLGGLTLRQFLMTKKFGPGDEPDLGGHTIFDTVTSPIGLVWLGRFIDEITDKVVKEEVERATQAAPAIPNAPPVPSAEGRGPT